MVLYYSFLGSHVSWAHCVHSSMFHVQFKFPRTQFCRVPCFQEPVLPGHHFQRFTFLSFIALFTWFSVSWLLCSQGTMFQGFYVPTAWCFRVLFSHLICFPELHVSKVLCFQGTIFPGSYSLWFPGHNVSGGLCFHSLCFPELHVSRVFRFLVSDSCPALIHFPEKPWP